MEWNRGRCCSHCQKRLSSSCACQVMSIVKVAAEVARESRHEWTDLRSPFVTGVGLRPAGFPTTTSAHRSSCITVLYSSPGGFFRHYFLCGASGRLPIHAVVLHNALEPVTNPLQGGRGPGGKAERPFIRRRYYRYPTCTGVVKKIRRNRE